ncbi:Rieske (2Fe-2S) protein [Dasania sp. GY-MA-18]|uniref:Rieske (2Fe-2S) protein n=1 Tax=Dasania phycosphaerae TaxID=2950436 RepID=A0A9J6RJT1_9GAMM|nr:MULTISPECIES: Rieske (2Fe-2S) protein [Dasania]MCR8921817.1 Rieske (2Fe-2S) protein [Dasania sp. GY-MA-18]MCZ0864245.1 Rieske (2Fe-2S) protein [Dasania phycosphaerae]MCZ0867973.1 Rieske (2Fe-2S) protein [Dasania phycosphaerae]
MQFYSLEKLINLHDGYRKQIKIDHHNLLLIQNAGTVYLLESLCPHRGHPLSESDISTDKIRCPLHGYEFAIAGGRLLHYSEEPCRALKTYELSHQGNELGVWL